MNLTRELNRERRSQDVLLNALYIEKQQVEGLRNELVTGGIKWKKAFSYVDNKLWETRREVCSLRVSLREVNKQLEEQEHVKRGTKRGLFIVEDTSPAKRQKVDSVGDRVAEMIEEIRSLREHNDKLISSLGERDTKLNEQAIRISDMFEEGTKLLGQKEDLEKEVHHLQQFGTYLGKSFQQAHQTPGDIDDGDFERTMSREIDEWEQGHGSRIVDITDEDVAL